MRTSTTTSPNSPKLLTKIGRNYIIQVPENLLPDSFKFLIEKPNKSIKLSFGNEKKKASKSKTVKLETRESLAKIEKRNIAKALRDIKNGRVHTMNSVEEFMELCR